MSLFAAKKTPTTPEEMFRALQGAWNSLLVSHAHEWKTPPSVDSLRVLCAQWAIETGRGKSMMNYNAAGIKASGDQDHTFYTTWEVMPRKMAEAYVANATALTPCEIISDNGELNLKVRFMPSHPMCRFRAYETLREGCVDYLLLLYRRFSLSWPSVLRGEPTQFAFDLKKQGYFTADAQQYAALMGALFKEFNFPALKEEEPAPDTLPTGVDPVPYAVSSGGLVELSLRIRDEEEKE